jgi:hypothetical protein
LDNYDSNDHPLEEAHSPVTITQIARTISAYRSVIGLIVLSVLVGYTILALTAYLLAPAVRLTTLNFRLEFNGAEKGQYPNGAKFSSSDIISTPLLLKTYRENDLQRFTKLSDFVASIFVVESNEARDALAREYQARLADTRLTSIDRERIQREYELKAGSLSKNQFSINYARRRRDSVPEMVARKVLHDILKNWASFAANDQHVLEYRISVLSPDVVAPNTSETTNPIIDAVILRRNVARLFENVQSIRRLPNGELVRGADGFSLADILVRLEDINRYRLDPLINRVAAAGLDNRAETLRFLSSQLAYDERVLQSQKESAAAYQQTLNMYMSAKAPREAPSNPVPSTAAAPRRDDSATETETLMPQISDSFIDRLIQLTNRSADTDFRQNLAEDYQKAMIGIVPTQQAVAYDQAVLETVRSTAGGPTADSRQVGAELAATRTDVRQLARKVQELHKVISRNLNPATELLVAGTPTSRVDRSISAKTLFLLGFLLTLIGLVLATLLSVVHSRIRSDRPADVVESRGTASS